MRRLEFLPYHFLLASIGEGVVLRYQVSTLLRQDLCLHMYGIPGPACTLVICRVDHIKLAEGSQLPGALMHARHLLCTAYTSIPLWRAGHEHGADSGAAPDADGRV